MKKIITLFLLCVLGTGIYAQIVSVNGLCISGPIVLANAGTINGKPAYQGSGTVKGYLGVNVVIQWIVPQNVWVLQFSGAAYFFNSCNTTIPPATGGASCVWQPAGGGTTCPGGTALSINGTGTLPIRLKEFTVIQKGNAVQLQWNSSNETNNKGFEINRSTDGITWSDMGFIPGNLTTDLEHNYSFMDERPIEGSNLYRLKQIDLDGKYTYSNIVAFNYSDQGNIKILGNDGRGIIHLEMSSNNEKLVLRIFDFNGRALFSKSTTNGNQILDISSFPAGIYLLQIKNKDQVITQKLIKS